MFGRKKEKTLVSLVGDWEIKSREIQSLEICALNLRLQAKTKRFELREIELEIRDRIKLDGQDVIILNSDAKDFKKKIIEGGYN